MRRIPLSHTLVFAALGLAAILDPQPFVLELLTQTAIFAIVAVGLNLLTGTTGLISLGQAGFFAVGAYVSALLMMHLQLDFVPAMIAGTLAAALLGAAVGFLGIRLRGHYLAIGTLAFGVIVFGLLAQLGITGGNIGLYGIPGLSFFGLSLGSASASFWTVWVVLLLAVAVVTSLQASRVGRALKAVRADEGVAASLGIGVTAMKVQVFAIAAGMAGAAGALYASYLQTLAPNMFGITLSFDLLLVVVLGGIENVPGTILAAALYTMVPDFGQGLGDWRLVGYAVLVLLAILIFPGGLGALLDRVLGCIARGVQGLGRMRGPARAGRGA